MTEDLIFRHQISRQHREVLAQYMERYPELALASARSREGLIQSKKMWEKIARTLNRIDDNVNKSGKGWARYWLDLKFKIRRKYAVIQKCHSEGTHCTIVLSPLEERIVKVLTDEEGNLRSTASVYHQMNSYHLMKYPLKGTGKSRLANLKSLPDDTKINDSGGLDTADEQSQDDYLVANSESLPEHVTIPDSSDMKPDINNMRSYSIPDPIEIVLPEEKKSIDELKRELVEFELRRQKELFEMEKQFKREKHEVEMAILRVKKQLMVKELKKL